MRNINITVILNFIKYFTTSQIEEIAKETGFIKRSDGKLLPMTFIKAFTIGLWSLQNKTLQHICGVCEDIQPNLSITKQALHQRLESGAALLKEMFKFALDYSFKNIATTYTADIIKQFQNIYICDATHLTLPKKLNKVYESSGGTNNNGLIKIQTMFNIITRSFVDIQIRKATENDRVYLRDVINKLQKRDLILYDLGFFATEIFHKIAEKGSYYISRIQNKTVFYANHDVSDEKPMDIKKILKSSEVFLDIDVFIGQKRRKRIPVRLVAIKLPKI